MSFPFQRLKLALGTGFDWTTDDLRVWLLDDATLIVPDPNIDLMTSVVGLLVTDNSDPVALSGRTVERDDPEQLTRFLADDAIFGDLGPGSGGPVVGAAIIGVWAGSGGVDSWPAIYLPEVTGATNGTDFTVAFDPAGVLRLRNPE